MLTRKKYSTIMLLSCLVIFSTPFLNYHAQGWATEYIQVTTHIGVWRCGIYCGSVVTVSTHPMTNTHFIVYHLGVGADGHDDGHDSDITVFKTEVTTNVSWLEDCNGNECNNV